MFREKNNFYLCVSTISVLASMNGYAGDNKTKKNDSLPTYEVSQLDEILHSRKMGGEIAGKKIRVRGKIAGLFGNTLTFWYSPKNFMYDSIAIDGLKDSELDKIKKDDYVEVTCTFTGDSDFNNNSNTMTFRFFGKTVRKL